MKGFNFTASRLSRYFHTRGVSTNMDVAKVWHKYISPTLDPDTGIASTLFGNSDEFIELDSESFADQSLSSIYMYQSPVSPLNKTPLSQNTQDVTPNPNSRYVSIDCYLSSVTVTMHYFYFSMLTTFHNDTYIQ